MSAVAVIPAFNEEASLGGVLDEIAEIEGLVPVVVADGSSDGTASVARNAGVACVRLPFNLGVGAQFGRAFGGLSNTKPTRW